MAEREIAIYRDLEELSRDAAEKFIGLAERAIRDSGRFSVALSGGSTPQTLYQLLAEPAYSERLPWQRVHFFWGDERAVPPDHPESNYGMARALLLSKIPCPDENIHRMAGEKEPELAAAEYQNTLQVFFGLAPGAWPRLDLMLMGIGEDGHTVSLFPDNDALENRQNLVVAPYVKTLNSYRLTLTLPLINHAANIWFLVAGASKAAVLGQILKADGAASKIPAARVDPISGHLVWLITQDAAAGSPSR